MVAAAKGVSMHTMSLAPGIAFLFQLAGVVHKPSLAAPVQKMVATGLHAVPPVTVMVAEAEALAGVGLVSFSATVAVLVIEPAAVAVTVMETEAVAPLASVPRLHVTVDEPTGMQGPWLAVAETSVSPAGSTSVTVTPVEFDGPLL